MRKRKKSTFALFFGNRGFFPETLIAEARKEVSESLKKLGHDYLLMDSNLTRFGAVESPEEGGKYARFLDGNRGKFEGIILLKIGYTGYRHHVSITSGHVAKALREAFTRYLGYEITEI